jgi:peptidoglycan/xylan/chitin deacetylase (PgdA/CDA1 family)
MSGGASSCIIDDMAGRKTARLGTSGKVGITSALMLIVVIAVAYGCAGNSGNKEAGEETENPNHWSELGSWLESTFKPPDEGKVKDGGLVTYREDLRGILPSAAPVQVITRGNPDLKRVALTIDDGWNADMRILDLLKQSGIEFTAFLIGGRGVAESNPGFVKAIQDAGGEVCSHTYSHYVMRGKDEAFVMDEIWRSQEVITRVTHEVYPYIRFSGGAYDQPALDWAAREGFWVVNWSASDNDTAPSANPDQQVNAVLSGLQNGAIILCHFGGHNTYDVLARILPEIEKRGYEVTSLSRVLEGTPFELKGNGKPAGN